MTALLLPNVAIVSGVAPLRCPPVILDYVLAPLCKMEGGGVCAYVFVCVCVCWIYVSVRVCVCEHVCL